jgi:hypothetical protein
MNSGNTDVLTGTKKSSNTHKDGTKFYGGKYSDIFAKFYNQISHFKFLEIREIPLFSKNLVIYIFVTIFFTFNFLVNFEKYNSFCKSLRKKVMSLQPKLAKF